MKLRIVRPGAGVVSWHRTLTGAERRLGRERRGAMRQGGYSQDYIEYFDGQNWVDPYQIPLERRVSLGLWVQS